MDEVAVLTPCTIGAYKLNRCLFEIYMKDGREYTKQQDFKNGILSYNKAVDMNPLDPSAVLARSRCYLQMGYKLHALHDAETVLDTNMTNPEALYAKAEALYQGGNYELSLVYYHRALKQKPGCTAYQTGIDKSQLFVLKFASGNNHHGVCAVGDLGVCMRRKKLGIVHGDTGMKTDIPSSDRTYDRPSPSSHDDFLSGAYCPLARITKKPRLIHLRSLDVYSDIGSSQKSYNCQQGDTRDVGESTLKRILGELYTDKEYLQELPKTLNIEKENPISDLAESGISFLQERGVFWHRLGPLPPPYFPNRPVHHRSNASRTLNPLNVYPLVQMDSAVQLSDQRRVPISPRTVDFNFDSYEPEGAYSVAMETDSHVAAGSLDLGRESARTATSVNTAQHDTRKQQTTMHIIQDLESIEMLYHHGKFSECTDMGEACLKELVELSEDEITDKAEILATLHSYLGNSSGARWQFSKAEYHHQQDLAIGEMEEMPGVISRALGNLGRVYISQQKYNKALDVLSIKAPMCVMPREVSWVFLEIGTCFTSLGLHDYARDCGRKALGVSMSDPDLQTNKFQAELLVASVQAKLKKYEDAFNMYKRALKLANQRDDPVAVTAIMREMRKLNRKMASAKSGHLPLTPGEIEHPPINTEECVTDPSRSKRIDPQKPLKTVPAVGHESANVHSVLKRLRGEVNTHRVYPLFERCDHSEELDGGEKEDRDMSVSIGRYKSDMITSPSKRVSDIISNMPRHISFKLWNDDETLFETGDDLLHTPDGKTGQLTNTKKINRAKALTTLRQRSQRNRYQRLNVDWTPPDIDMKKYTDTTMNRSIGVDDDHYESIAPTLTENRLSVVQNNDITDTMTDTMTDSAIVEEKKAKDGKDEMVGESVSKTSNVNLKINASHKVPDYVDGKQQRRHPADGAYRGPDEEVSTKDNDAIIDVADGTLDGHTVSFREQERIITEASVLEEDKSDDTGFLYPHDKVAFTCPFEGELVVDIQDILSVSDSEEHVSPSHYETKQLLNLLQPRTVDTDTSQISDIILEEGHYEVELDIGSKQIQDDKSLQEAKPSTADGDRKEVRQQVGNQSERAKISDRKLVKSNRNRAAVNETKMGAVELASARHKSIGKHLKVRKPQDGANQRGTVRQVKTTSEMQDAKADKFHVVSSRNIDINKGSLYKSKFHPGITRKLEPVSEKPVDISHLKIAKTLSEPNEKVKGPIFKSKYHALLNQKLEVKHEDKPDVTKTYESDESKKSDMPKVPVFKSKYHEQFNKKIATSRKLTGDPDVDIEHTDDAPTDRSEQQHKGTGQLYKSKYHEQFIKELESSRTVTGDTDISGNQYSDAEIYSYEQNDKTTGPLYKSKYHEQFSPRLDISTKPTKPHSSPVAVQKKKGQKNLEMETVAEESVQSTTPSSTIKPASADPGTSRTDDAGTSRTPAGDRDASTTPATGDVGAGETAGEHLELVQAEVPAEKDGEKVTPRKKAINPVLKNSPYTISLRTPRAVAQQKEKLQKRQEGIPLSSRKQIVKLEPQTSDVPELIADKVDSSKPGSAVSLSSGKHKPVSESKVTHTPDIPVTKDEKNIDLPTPVAKRKIVRPYDHKQAAKETIRKRLESREKVKEVGKLEKPITPVRTAVAMDGSDGPAIQGSEIPPFVQKKKLVFKMSKRDGKVVFSPIQPNEQNNNWKLIYMRIRKGDRTFSIPVARDASSGAPIGSTDGPAIQGSEIPPFVQKKKLIFKLTKKDGKVVFSPIPVNEQNNNWKLLYMRIRKGDRTFSVPVAKEKSDLSELGKLGVPVETTQRHKAKTDSKQQFRNTSKKTIPESNELGRPRRLVRKPKPVVIPVKDDADLYKARRIDMKFLGTLFKETKPHAKRKSKKVNLMPRGPKTIEGGAKLKVPHGQEVVYKRTDRDGKIILVPVVKNAIHKIVLVKVKQKDKSYILPIIVKRS